MPVPTSIADFNNVAASNSPQGSDPIGTSLDDYLRGIQAVVKGNLIRGADLTAASILPVPNDGSYFVVTGTSAISTIAGTYAGRVVILQFPANGNITHSASLILPNAVNIKTSAGDVGIFVNESIGPSVWRCVSYLRASPGFQFLKTTTFSTPGAVAFTPDTRTKLIIAEGVGGGGGGGGAPATAAGQAGAGGGGGGGGYFKFIDTDPQTAGTYTVGANGLGGTGTLGTVGGSTVYKTATASGGLPGLSLVGSSGAGTIGAGQAGGSGTGGAVNIPGQRGQSSHSLSTVAANTGSGGSSMLGFGGHGTFGTTVDAATGFGAGGAGSTNWASAAATSGQNGTAGALIIHEYA